MSFLKSLCAVLDETRIFRRISLLWAIWLITWTVQAVFSDITKITSAVATALATVVGILSVIIAFYQTSRSKQERDR